ncbi:OppA family ABC transporter substrate-binding lipoprotein [Metamycoplasma hyosynoviae]|uniref:OppA family ABC transporter substrate-binding lipoprotein n=2 Tax=Metamycoplasma hyosynoviae TaxID=29559 RepID=UPI002360DE0A|nr:hypothetical protein [Metamycoplasma hyosynoviae]MDD1359073.1 hypothetical protein [Metamycoplasma hyosynoviae]
MKLKAKWLLLASIATIFAPLVALSCTNDYNPDRDNLIYYFNHANKAKNYFSAYANSHSQELNALNLATGAKLFRLSSQNQPEIDFRDNIVTKPTELWYKTEYAKWISFDPQITDLYGNITQGKAYENDHIKKTIYEETLESNQKPEFFYPKKDKGLGFYSPYLFIPSAKENSINHPNFLEELKTAEKITLNLTNGNTYHNNYWVNHRGEIVNKKYQVSAIDFRLGLFRSALQNKAFRQQFIKENNLTEMQKLEDKYYEKDNPYFNGDSVYDMFKSYNVDTKNFFNYQKIEEYKLVGNSAITFDISSPINNIDFFNNLFIYSNYMDAIPYDFLQEKYAKRSNDSLFSDKSFAWFYEYGRTYDSTLYASYYYVAKNSSSETKLYRNENFYSSDLKWQELKHLNEIVYKYNEIPSPNETYNIQQYNLFKQNLVSNLNVSTLNADQKEFIFKNFEKFNLNYTRQFEKYKLHSKIFLNYLPSANEFYFNDLFACLYYGSNAKELTKKQGNIDFNPEIIVFQNLINRVINPYVFISLLQKNSEIWMSQAPSDIKINAQNIFSSNYENLKDALVPINNQIVLKNTNGKIENNSQFSLYDNKQKINDVKAFSNNFEKYKSIDFENIKSNITNIIENFYAKHPEYKTQNIEWQIPIAAFNLSQSIKEFVKTIENIYNQLHPKLKPKIVLIDDYYKYDEYFKKNKSIYKHIDFTLSNSSSNDYLKKLLSINNYEMVKLFNKIVKVNGNQAVFKNLKKLLEEKPELIEKIINAEELDINKNKFEVFLNDYLNKLSTSDTLHLINEINNLISYTLSFENNVQTDSFSKIVYQNYIYKPLVYDGLEYFQDIFIK